MRVGALVHCVAFLILSPNYNKDLDKFDKVGPPVLMQVEMETERD